MTGDNSFYDAAKRATSALWALRSANSGLLGTHINVLSSEWVMSAAGGLGGDTDSAYEMLYKSSRVFDDPTYAAYFDQAHESIHRWLRVEGPDFLHYVDCDLSTGVKHLTIRSLAAFWPGVEAMMGRVADANKTIHSWALVLRTFGFLPEAVCLTQLPQEAAVAAALEGLDYRPGISLDGYPLRPELIESIFHTYRVTRDPSLLKVALMTVQALRTTRVPCGYAGVQGVLKVRPCVWQSLFLPSHHCAQLEHRLVDKMDSFFLSEVLKYLYLLFHDAAGRSHWALDGGYVFTTEAHLLPSKMTRPQAMHVEL